MENETESLGFSLDRFPVEGENADRSKLISRIADVSPDWLYVYDLDRRCVTYSNNRLFTMLGYPESLWPDLRCERLIQLIHWQDRPIADLAVIRSRGLKDEEADQIEFRCLHFDGTYRWIQCRNTVFARDARGLVTQLVGVGRDVTEQRQTTHELEFLSEELRYARDEALRSSKAKGDFLSYISHEVRTLLSGVVGLASVLGRYEMPADARQLVSTIQDSGESVIRVIGNVLDLAKIEAGLFELSATPTDLIALLRSILDSKAAESTLRGTVLHLDLPATIPPTVLVDDLRLRQILTNLVGNAVKFTSAGRVEILFSCTEIENVLRCSFQVRDTGIGIDPDRLEAIFDEYTQESFGTEREFGGTGLGLSIARSMAMRMGGALSAESEVGQGSTFTLDLDLPISSYSVAPSEPFTLARFDGLKVLLAEDNQVNILVATSHLAEFGCVVDIAHTGPEAVALAAENRYDIILMDLRMPGYDGTSASRRIRNMGGQRSQVPIVALTATVLQEDRQSSYDSGMDGFLTKPFTIEALQEILVRYTGQPSRR